MEELGTDALLVCARDDGTGSDRGRFQYIADFEFLPGRCFVLLFLDSPPVLLQPAYVGRAWANHASRIAEIVVATDQIKAIVEVLKRRRILGGRLGVVGLKDVIAVSDWQDLKAATEGTELIDATDPFDRVMTIKSSEEINCLEETAEMCRQAFLAIQDALRPGVTERFVASAAFCVIKEMGGKNGFLNIARSGGIPVFHPPTADVLQKGDIIGFDLEHRGPSHYGMEVAKYFSLGLASLVERERLAAQEVVFDAAVSSMRPGAAVIDVMEAMAAAADRVGLELAGPVGLGPVMFHGHGVGMNFFEPPFIPSANDVILEGMTIALHPWTGPEDPSALSVVALDTVLVQAEVTRPLVFSQRNLVEV